MFPKMQQIDQELTRANTARVAYIAWRMADVPGLYQNLMPVTYSLRELYIAERQIRAQLAADLKWLATTPAQRSGIAPWALLDDDDFKGSDREEFDRDLCLREYKEMGPMRDLSHLTPGECRRVELGQLSDQEVEQLRAERGGKCPENWAEIDAAGGPLPPRRGGLAGNRKTRTRTGATTGGMGGGGTSATTEKPTENAGDDEDEK